MKKNKVFEHTELETKDLYSLRMNNGSLIEIYIEKDKSLLLLDVFDAEANKLSSLSCLMKTNETKR